MYRKNNKWRRRIASIIVIFVILAMLGGSLAAIFAPTAKAMTDDNYIYKGVSIAGIDLSGKGIEQAQRTVDEYLQTLQSRRITLYNGKKEQDVSMSELGLTYTNKAVVEDAYNLGKTGNVIRRYKDTKDLENEGVDLPLNLTLTQNQVKEVLKEKGDDFVTHAKDASLIRQNGKFIVKKEQVGESLDIDSTVSRLKKYVGSKWNGKDTRMKVSVLKEEPKHKAAELKSIKNKLGTYSTDYSGSNDNRKKNIARAASLLNGIVLYPGEVISVQNTIAPIDGSNGYALAGSYLDGKVVDSFGGGVCQVSTTLYNAVIRAELEIVERHNHTMTVHYVPLSSDAAIATGSMDFQFKNNKKTPIYIATDADGSNLYMSIYGKETRSKNRTIKFRSETLETYEAPKEPVYNEDDTVPAGTEFVSQSAVTGYKAQLYKDIYKNGKKVKSVLLNTSTYLAEPEHITIGTGSDDSDE